MIRLVAPGNGWGKTSAAACEADWWGHGDHPYQIRYVRLDPRRRTPLGLLTPAGVRQVASGGSGQRQSPPPGRWGQ